MAGIRRTWDKDYYEKRARERAEQGDSFEEVEAGPKSKARKTVKVLLILDVHFLSIFILINEQDEFKAADDDSSGPMGSKRAFLKSREHKIDLETKVGKVEIINPTSAESSRSAGFFCEVCSCLLKDSASYLDHINGRKRN